MESIITSVGHFALNIISTTGYVGVFVLSLFESAGIPIPSEVVLPFSGFLVTTGRFNLVLLVLVATLANLIGSIILYWIGRSGGRLILEKYGKYILITPAKISFAENWFKKHGTKTVFWGRMIPIARTFISLPPGIARMNFKKFIIYTFAGALIWNLALGYVGVKAGENWEVLGQYFHQLDILIGAVVIVGILWLVFKNKLHKNHG